ncbi:protein 4.1b isoform X3 [Clupea harengus]|uniref:Protein 4.1b isoform X3 n=1 Tax=Clupea harengus TaxID=7950 RepID=A0A6P8FWN8_CLUHA|nr:protein 4.1b isoform X3 [Clupea harengus]
MLCRVILLDRSVREWNLPSNATGKELFDQVCEHLNLLERDYFGLAIFDSLGAKTWLDVSKQINKQLKGIQPQFVFSVKFYPPNPAQLCEDLTRYLMCLQLRRDLLTSRLPCQSATLIALGSYVLQSEFGQYDPDLHGNTYTNSLYLAPNQNEVLLKRMKELHHTYGSMSSAQADLLFLQKVCELPMYGIDRHPAKNSDGEDVVLGVSSEGILLYRDDIVESKFLWPRVLKVSYKHSKFLFRTHPSEGSVWTLCFTLPSNRACKSLWKVALEHHSFFRLPSVEVSQRRLLTLRTQFHYHGRTEAESLQASSEITRPNPAFQRKPRAKSTSLDALTRTNQPELDDWFLELDSIPAKPLCITAVDEGPVLVNEWKRESEDWLLFLDQTNQTLMHLDSDLSNTNTPQEDLEQDLEDSSVGDAEGEPAEEEITGEPQEEELMEEPAEEFMEEETERHEEGELLEIRQVKEVKTVRKISERAESSEGEGEILKYRLRGRGILDVQSDDWYFLFDRQSSKFDPKRAVKQVRILEQQQELVAGIMGEKLAGLVMSSETEQEWEVVEESQQKAMEEGEQEGETVEIRRQKLKIVRKRTVEVEVEEEMLSLKEDFGDEMQKEIEVIQDLQELVVVEEMQVELEILKERLREVDFLEYKVQKMEQQRNEETPEDNWLILLDQLPYIIYPAPLAGHTSEAVEEQEIVEMPVDQRTEEAILIVKEGSEEQVVIEEGMEESVIIIERGVITEPITLQNNLYSGRDIDDDWFLLLEPVPLEDRRTVGDSQPYTTGPTYEPEEEAILEREESDQAVIMEQTAKVPDEPGSISETTAEQIILQRTNPGLQYIEDDWFLFFDQVPVQSKTPPSVVWEDLQRPADINTISVEIKAEEQGDEEMTEEMTERQEQIKMEAQPTIQEQRPKFTPIEVEDDWYIVLEVPPKETVEVKVEVMKGVSWEERITEQVTRTEEKRSIIERHIEVRVVESYTEDAKGEVEVEKVTIMEERNIDAENPGEYITLQMNRPVAVRDIEDDWFMLLEPTPVDFKPSPSVAWEREQASQETLVRVDTETTLKRVRIAEEEVMIIEEREQHAQKPTVVMQSPPVVPRDIEDDWFLLLESVPVEVQSPPSVWVSPPYRAEALVRVDTETTIKRVRIAEEEVMIIEEREQHAQKPTVVMQSPPVVPRDIEDDWFLLLESVPVEVQSPPSVWVSPPYRAEALVRVDTETTIKRVRIAEEEVMIIEEREQHAQKPTVVMQSPPVVPRDIEDDWFLLLESVPVEVQSPPSVVREKVSDVSRVTVEVRAERDEERRRMEKMTERQEQIKMEAQPTIQEQRPKFTPIEVEDDWYIVLEVPPKETVEVKVEVMKGVSWEERITEQVTRTEEKRSIIEKHIEQLQPQKKHPAVVCDIDDDWFMLLDPVLLQERSVPSVETRTPVDVSKTKDQRVAEKARPGKEIILEKERLREQEMQRISQQSVFVGVREIEDDWFKHWDKTILLYQEETRSAVISKPEEQRAVERKGIEKGRIMEKERMKEEDMRKRVTIAEANRVRLLQESAPPAGREVVDDWFILLDKVSVEVQAPPRVALIIPPTPAKRPLPVGQPLTSTPTIHPAPIIKYIEKEEKRETQVTVEEKEDEELTIIRRKTRAIEGETIYIRHSILMLEDFDVTQEVVLRHHASISEMKRLFMEAEPEPHLSEWDKHLSICHLDTHTHLISMEEWEREERESIM